MLNKIEHLLYLNLLYITFVIKKIKPHHKQHSSDEFLIAKADNASAWLA